MGTATMLRLFISHRTAGKLYLGPMTGQSAFGMPKLLDLLLVHGKVILVMFVLSISHLTVGESHPGLMTAQSVFGTPNLGRW
jgi:hypothetical protein